MYITSGKNVLLKAQRQGCTMPAFDTHNPEITQVVAETAAELCSFLTLTDTPGIYSYAGTGNVVAIACDLVKRWDLPPALYLDHHEGLADIMRKVQAGIRSVVIDGSHPPPEENVALVKSVVELSRHYGAGVGTELGRLGGIEDDLIVDIRGALYINPEQAHESITRINIDPLVVAIGTAHSLYTAEPKSDFERLAAIHDYVDVPLVLCDTSGLSDSDTRRATPLGAYKVNVATELKTAPSDALKAHFLENPGVNGPRHYMKPAKTAMREVARKVVHACGCEGQL